MTFSIRILSGLICLVLAACTSYYMPLPAPQMDIVGRQLIYESDSLQITIHPHAWHYSPATLDDFFFPVFCSILNKGTTPVSFSKEDFVLLDDRREQHFAANFAEVRYILYGSLHNAGWDDSSLAFLAEQSNDQDLQQFVEEQRTEQDQELLGIQNLYQRQFRFDHLAAGRRQSGFIYFERPLEKTTEITIIIQNREFVFRQEK